MRYTLMLLILAFSCTKDKQPNSGVSNKVTLGPTSQVTSIMVNSAVSGGNVLTVGVDDVIEKGVCWNTAGKPTISNSKSVNGKGLGAFTSNLTNLAPGTRYSVRSYATTQNETLYGTEVTFTTLLCPTVGTGTILDITGSSATASGNLTSNGGQTILERGICYGTSTNPTISNSRVVVIGTSLGIFSANISGLAGNTTYFLRAYVTTSACVATYGNEVTFKTPSVPVLTTNAVSNIGLNDAFSGGNVTNDGGSPVSARGVCWSANPGPTINNTLTLNGTGVGSFNSSISGLAQNTTYYVRSYATNAAGTGYGNEIIFKTMGLPQLATNVASSITSVSAFSGGSVISDGGLPVTARGVCWSISQGSTPAGSRTIDGSGLGQFSSSITGLVANTRYYYRAYATHSLGTGYGPELSFVTGFTTPTVLTSSVSSITQTSAVGGGQVSNDGGAAVTSRGVCWNTNGNPTISDSRTINGSGTGSFGSSITGLAQNTTYYVRSFATNAAGTAYGNEISFKTISLPQLATTVASSITAVSAVSGGSVVSDGGLPVTARGVCWSTSPNPTPSGSSRTIDGSGLGSFSSSITGLVPNTRYYYRAYASHSLNTGYGPELSFVTGLTIPTVSTSSISSITQTSAVGGGQVSNDGGAAVTSRGVCWNMSGNPSIFDSRTFDGSGTGSFASSITGLSQNRMYYVRAYATNSAGTAYGPQTTFTTQSITCPTISTSGATGTTSNSVSIGGNVSSAGGGTVSVRGVCWNTTGSPTVSNTRTVNGSGTGSFSSQMTSLQPGTTYYVRAYATNEVCTTYGAQVAVTTNPLTLSAPTLSSPLLGATIRCCSANFSWSSVANANGYEIQISRSSTFSGIIYTTTSIDCGGGLNPQTTGVNSRNLTATTYCMRMGTPSLNGTWYWRVRAYYGSIYSSWSTVRSYSFIY